MGPVNAMTPIGVTKTTEDDDEDWKHFNPLISDRFKHSELLEKLAAEADSFFSEEYDEEDSVIIHDIQQSKHKVNCVPKLHVIDNLKGVADSRIKLNQKKTSTTVKIKQDGKRNPRQKDTSDTLLNGKVCHKHVLNQEDPDKSMLNNITPNKQHDDNDIPGNGDDTLIQKYPNQIVVDKEYKHHSMLQRITQNDSILQPTTIVSIPSIIPLLQKRIFINSFSSLLVTVEHGPSSQLTIIKTNADNTSQVCMYSVTLHQHHFATHIDILGNDHSTYVPSSESMQSFTDHVKKEEEVNHINVSPIILILITTVCDTPMSDSILPLNHSNTSYMSLIDIQTTLFLLSYSPIPHGLVSKIILSYPLTSYIPMCRYPPFGLLTSFGKLLIINVLQTYDNVHQMVELKKLDNNISFVVLIDLTTILDKFSTLIDMTLFYLTASRYRCVIMLSTGMIYMRDEDGIWERLDELSFSDSDFSLSAVSNCSTQSINDAKNETHTFGILSSISKNKYLEDIQSRSWRLQHQSSLLLGHDVGASLGHLLLRFLKSSQLKYDVFDHHNIHDECLPNNHQQTIINPLNISVKLLSTSLNEYQTNSHISLNHLNHQIHSAAFLGSLNEFLSWLRLFANRSYEQDNIPVLHSLFTSLLRCIKLCQLKDISDKIGFDVTTQKHLMPPKKRQTWGHYGLNTSLSLLETNEQLNNQTDSKHQPVMCTNINNDELILKRSIPVFRWCQLDNLKYMGLSPEYLMVDIVAKLIFPARWVELKQSNNQHEEHLQSFHSTEKHQPSEPVPLILTTTHLEHTHTLSVLFNFIKTELNTIRQEVEELLQFVKHNHHLHDTSLHLKNSQTHSSKPSLMIANDPFDDIF